MTDDGREYVVDAIGEHLRNGSGRRDVLKEWADHYGFFLPDKPLEYADLRSEFALMSDGDSWGDVMSAWFDVAAEIYNREPADVPAAWRYQPGMLGNRREFDHQFAFDCAIATTSALQEFGAMLTRYAAKLKAAGRSY